MVSNTNSVLYTKITEVNLDLLRRLERNLHETVSKHVEISTM